MIQVTEYWNKIIDDKSAPFGTKVLSEYEIYRQYTMDSDFELLKKRWKNNSKMTIEADKITEDKGKYYGIHSYVVITSC